MCCGALVAGFYLNGSFRREQSPVARRSEQRLCGRLVACLVRLVAAGLVRQVMQVWQCWGLGLLAPAGASQGDPWVRLGRGARYPGAGRGKGRCTGRAAMWVQPWVGRL